MDSTAETFEHAGLTVRIGWEQDGCEFADPRDADNIGTMFCWHPDYTLGDEQFPSDDLPEFESMSAVKRYLIEDRGAVMVLPLYLLDHSGISMSVGAPSFADTPCGGVDDEGNRRCWDTSHVGYIYTTRARIAELCGEPQLPTDEFYCPRTWPEDGRSGPNWTGTAREWIARELETEVRYYDAYLQGSVYYWTVEDEDGNVLESCGGFLVASEADDEYMRSEARSAAEGESARIQSEDIEYAASARCRYDDCHEGHAVADEDEQVTCRSCREWLGLPSIEREEVAA